MIGKKIEAAFNDQFRHELESSYIYLSMAAWFHDRNLDGMAQWMKVQAREEMEHAMKFFDFVVKRGGRVNVPALTKPQSDWSSPLEAFQAAYGHEQFITGRINELVKEARQEVDNAAESFLKWFVDEQVEEEDNALKIVRLLEQIQDHAQGLIMLDYKLGERK